MVAEQIDTSTPSGRLTFHIFSALAEFERSLIRERTLADLAADSILACTDDGKVVIAFLQAERVEYELIIASKGEHVHEKALHIQNVNAYASRFKQRLGRFNGVATQYLQSYLGWRRWLEKEEDSKTRKNLLTAAFC